MARGTTLDTVHEILGHRFDTDDRVRIRSRHLSLTIISIWVEHNDCYVHWSNGAKEHLNLREVMKLIRTGRWVESIEPPFVWPSDNRKISEV